METLLRRLALACLTIALAPLTMHAQDACGAHPTPDQARHMRETRMDRQNYDRASMRGTVRWIPITFHAVARTNGTGGVDPIIFPSLINRLNIAFAPANVQFFQCGRHEVIPNDGYFDLTIGGVPTGMMSEDDILGNAHDVPNTMNIYFFNTIYDSGGSLAGYAFFPGEAERVYIRNGNAMNQGLIEHEAGHFFSLYHTHEHYSDPDLAECTNGSNGTSAGDEIQDTPADPRLDMVGMMSGCTYVGSTLDPCGNTYAPMTSNYMSYAGFSCRSDFSTGQLNRIAYSAMYERAGLNCSNSNYIPCSSVVSSFPYTQDFEAGNLGDWRNILTDNFDWQVVSAGPHAPATGPSSAANGTKFAYIEASGNTPNRMAILDGPCFDLSMITNPTLQFRYHMVGANTGSLRLEGSTDGGGTWTSLFYKYGEQASGWQTSTVSLSGYASQTTLKLRLVATTTLASLGDIAIDRIQVYAQPCAANVSLQVVDIGCQNATNGQISVVNAPQGSTYAWATGGEPTTVIGTGATLSSLAPGPYQVTVTSAGCSDVLGRDVEVSNFRLQITPTQPTAIAATGSLNVTFAGGAQPYSLLEWIGPANGSTTSLTGNQYVIPNLPAGDYQVRITDASGCQTGASAILQPFSPGYCQCSSSVTIGTVMGFESGLGAWQSCSDPSLFDWATGTGDAAPTGTTGPTSSTAPNPPAGAYAGQYYAYCVSSSYNQAGGHYGAMLRSPCLDFAGITNPGVRFRYHQYRTNGPIDPVTLYLWNASSGEDAIPVWTSSNSSSDQWIQATVDLSLAGNTSGEYQLLFSQVCPNSTTNDFGLDEVELLDFSNSGLTASVSATASSCGSTGAASVTASCSGAITYSWSNGATTQTVTGLAPNTALLVTVTCNTAPCNRILMVRIPDGSMIPAIFPTNPVMAGLNDGSMDLHVGGGQAPFTYSWTGPSGFTATTEDISNLAPGTYFVTITDSKGCTKTANGSILEGSCPNIVSTFPMDESWEVDFGNWTNPVGEAASHFNWSRLSGPTPAPSSGPSAANHLTWYVYMNSAANPAGAQAHLVSYCIDLRRSTAASFTFDYHAWHSNPGNSDMGDLYLDISTNQGSNWTTLATIVTVRTSSNKWYTYPSVSLNAYLGKVVQLRFRGVMGVANRSDIALDHPRITGTFYKDTPETQESLSDGISLYPNPTSGQLNVGYALAESCKADVSIMDLSGGVLIRQSHEHSAGRNSISVDVSDLPAGMYLLQVCTPDSRSVRRFVVSH